VLLSNFSRYDNYYVGHAGGCFVGSFVTTMVIGASEKWLTGAISIGACFLMGFLLLLPLLLVLLLVVVLRLVLLLLHHHHFLLFLYYNYPFSPLSPFYSWCNEFISGSSSNVVCYC